MGCEVTWDGGEPHITYDGVSLGGDSSGGSLSAIIFIGFYWHTWSGTAGRAIRRLYPRNPVPLANRELCETCIISIVTTYSGRACCCPSIDGDQSLITEPFYLCRGGACYCSTTARALGVFSFRSRSFKAGG